MKIVLLIVGFAVLALSKTVSQPSHTFNQLVQDAPAEGTLDAPSVARADVKTAN